jgi:hypothetical protein
MGEAMTQRRKLIVGLAVAAALLPLAACANKQSPPLAAQPPCAGPQGVDGTAPAGSGPGDLVSSEELTSSSKDSPGFPTGARAWRILYVSTAVDEHDLRLVCGTVVAPATGPASFDTPDGRAGRLLAWAHGTIGLDQRCLPSSDPATHIWGPMPSGIQTVSWGSLLGEHQGRAQDGALQYAMDQGWVVAATDYQPDDSYIIGKVAAANVLDSARAATQLMDTTFSTGTPDRSDTGTPDRYDTGTPDRYDTGTPDRYDMVTWGHSQGGHAALWAGQLAESYLAGTKPGKPTAAIHLSGVVALAPAGNFVVQPELQPTLAEGDGLADQEMHQAVSAINGINLPALEVQIGPALFSYIFGSWSQFAASGTPARDARFPAYPADAGGLRLADLATAQGIGTIAAVQPQCLAGSGATAIKAAVAPYRDAATSAMLLPELWNLPKDYRAGDYFRGGIDKACATNDNAGFQRWCDWIRWNLPGPLGRNPFAKVPATGGRPVPLLMAQGTDDEVIHCISPDGLPDASVPGAADCTSTALFDAYSARAYCPDGTPAAGHLEHDLFRPVPLESPASHFSIPGQMSARGQGRSDSDLSFEGSPVQAFMQGAFERTLEPGCTQRIMNP